MTDRERDHARGAHAWILLALVLGAVLLRLIPHPPNLSPVAALALFAGAHFADRRLAFIVPLTALLASDLVIGLHDGMLFVYGAFALTVLLGLRLRAQRGAGRVAGAAVLASVLFFLLTNFGAWLTLPVYPASAAGLAAAYAAGLPFFQYTLLGDLFYTVLLFGGYAALRRRYMPAPFPDQQPGR